jgi:hypothetical protein
MFFDAVNPAKSGHPAKKQTGILCGCVYVYDVTKAFIGECTIGGKQKIKDARRRSCRS